MINKYLTYYVVFSLIFFFFIVPTTYALTINCSAEAYSGLTDTQSCGPRSTVSGTHGTSFSGSFTFSPSVSSADYSICGMDSNGANAVCVSGGYDSVSGGYGRLGAFSVNAPSGSNWKNITGFINANNGRADGYFTMNETPDVQLGTVCVAANISTSWTVSGPGGWNTPSGGPGGQCRDVRVGSYSISAPGVAGYDGPSFNHPTTQTLTAGAAISWDITYSLISGGGGGGGGGGSAPTVSFSASPTSITSGGSSTLSWTVSGATSCTASGDWSGTKASASGTYSELQSNILSNKTYTLSCANGNGTTIRTANVTVAVGCSGLPVTTTSGPYTVLTFGCNGNWTAPSGVTSVDYLLVGGGGGGGDGGGDAAGGGGGGRVLSGSSAVTPSTVYPIVVGLSGSGGIGATSGNSGTVSTFNSISAQGGSFGASISNNAGSGTIGGGGGGGGNRGVGTVSSGGSGNVNCGGGGGGAGGNGVSCPGFGRGANGGTGVASAITGLTVRYGGGGGGGGYSERGLGIDGGGNGGEGVQAGFPGTDGLGGGGGGARFNGGGGRGGSGIVIIRYLTPVVVNGVCGTANKNYASGDTSYGSDSFCTTGTVSPASPAFPAAGTNTNWICLGSGGGTNSSQCTATRSPLAGNSLTVVANTSLGGFVKSSDNLIDTATCGSPCTRTYGASSSVTLQAYPASTYWKFSGWSGDCSGLGLCSITVNAPKSVTATFVPRLFNYIEF